MPAIEKLHQAMAPQGLEVVAVSMDDPGFEDKIRAFVKEFGLTFQILYDPSGKITNDYQTTGVPETFIIARDGDHSEEGDRRVGLEQRDQSRADRPTARGAREVAWSPRRHPEKPPCNGSCDRWSPRIFP